MRMQLPLERLASLGEHPHLSRDQLVQLDSFEPAEVAIVDEPTMLGADYPHQRPVMLDVDTLRQLVGQLAAKLRVVGGQQRGDVWLSGHRKELLLTRRGRKAPAKDARTVAGVAEDDLRLRVQRIDRSQAQDLRIVVECPSLELDRLRL